MTDAFHDERATGIGGSDVASIVGLSRHGSPYTVWARLVGLLPPSESTQRQVIGQELEGAIARLFHRETGLHVASEQMPVRHQRRRWARGFIDGLVFDGDVDEPCIDLALGGFEAKTDGRFGWSDGVPVDYQAQAQWYMLITGLERWWFGVLFAGFRFQTFELKADRADQRLLAYRAARLWYRHVLTGVPPPIDGSDATSDALRAIHPNHVEGETAELDGLADIIIERFDLKEVEADTKARLKVIDNTIRERLGDAEVGTLAGIPMFTYRASERKGYTVEPTTVRTLRTINQKGN